jgi:peptidoglycan/xylan/chitin deacetylase (PgdA/CDA1 family)
VAEDGRNLRRSARLLLGDGAPEEASRLAAVRAALRQRPVPSPPVRFAQRVQRKLGRLEYGQAVAEPLIAARRAALGPDADGPPRFLVRVDEFPHYMASDRPETYGTGAYRRFHALMRQAGVPYLVAVLPRVSAESLNPHGTRWRELTGEERELLQAMPAEGVSYGLHGLDHRTRHASPRRHSELCGLSAAETERLLDTGLGELEGLGLRPRVFVPPFNRFDAAQYEILARRFDVVCGGPESVGLLGFQRSPVWRGEAVYLPAYHPLYARAGEVLGGARALIDREAALWAPIALHWGWEADEGWGELERLLETIAPYAAHWDDFLAEVDASRAIA